MLGLHHLHGKILFITFYSDYTERLSNRIPFGIIADAFCKKYLYICKVLKFKEKQTWPKQSVI